ncbi:MAG: hypothetical protein IPN33_10230 [Saprospiraceae bacterium]|nr:hypothetical protein [Saprospiraceae bacterium]
MSDEIDAGVSGVRRNVFMRGAIYYAPKNIPIETYGHIYRRYLNLGGSTSFLGLPIRSPLKIKGGSIQAFERGMIFHDDSKFEAFEVHGDILDKFLTTGGITAWGFPLNNESDLFSRNGIGEKIGRFNNFEKATIFWSPETGAHLIQKGQILDKYEKEELGGPIGLPITDELYFTDAKKGNVTVYCFENGSITFYSSGETIVNRPFKLYFGEISTQDEDNWPSGENDLYGQLKIMQNGSEIYNQRIPEEGILIENNSGAFNFQCPIVITPNNALQTIHFEFEIWDDDGGLNFDRDHLGTLKFDLDVFNSWGLKGNPSGLFKSTGFDKTNSFKWAIQPDFGTGDVQDFWECTNKETIEITHEEFALAFINVYEDPEWTDIEDHIEYKFRNSIRKSAEKGNCFWNVFRSLVRLERKFSNICSLKRFNDFTPLEDIFNIKHIYQLGDSHLWWRHENMKRDFNSAKNVFWQTKIEAESGSMPLINFFSNYDFTGGGHTVLPIGWAANMPNWEIIVFDPNTGNSAPQKIIIDPVKDTFQFNSSGLRNYSGAIKSGSRIFYSPWHTVNHRQEVPSFDPTLLLLGGLLFIVMGSVVTDSITSLDSKPLEINDISKTQSIYTVKILKSIQIILLDMDIVIMVADLEQ